MHEGLDLKDDLSRFQLILKVPYPSFVENPQLEMRMKISSDYYNYLTAMKIVQSYGRSIRSETDFAKTYILDEDFKSFFARSKQILPRWFKQAIVW
jgi:Rad3-related DNA helicase